MRHVVFLCVTIFALLSVQKSYARSFNSAILNVAKGQIGVRERAGRKTNPTIARYFVKAVGHKRTDQTPWCSAFMGYVTKRAGYRGTNSLAARSWLRWGKKVRTPRRGDIVIFRRGGGGHVGIFIKYTGKYILVLGGNQNNTVSYKRYAISRFLGFRSMRKDVTKRNLVLARIKRKRKKQLLARIKSKRKKQRLARLNNKRKRRRFAKNRTRRVLSFRAVRRRFAKVNRGKSLYRITRYRRAKSRKRRRH